MKIGPAGDEACGGGGENGRVRRIVESKAPPAAGELEIAKQRGIYGRSRTACSTTPKAVE